MTSESLAREALEILEEIIQGGLKVFHVQSGEVGHRPLLPQGLVLTNAVCTEVTGGSRLELTMRWPNGQPLVVAINDTGGRFARLAADHMFARSDRTDAENVASWLSDWVREEADFVDPESDAAIEI